MQAGITHARFSVTLSRTRKGKPRKEPVWLMRYRLPSGKDSSKVLGKAWLKKGRPPRGCLTEREALAAAESFAADHSAAPSSGRRTLRAALNEFLRHCEHEKELRGSTLDEYRKIGERLAGRRCGGTLLWADRVLDTFTDDELLAVRKALSDAGRRADTLNHYRRVVRGIFGTQPTSPALAWAWKTAKVQSEGKLSFYTPAQVDRLIVEAYTDQDAAIYTLASEAGPRLSEIRALKVEDVDFEVDQLRFEDGYTTKGGFAGNKGRRTRSVPMSANVRRVLLPFCEGKAGEELVFQSQSKPGEPICGVSLYRRFLSAAKRAGLPRLRLHDLRHTFGTQAIRVFKVHEVQWLMGHRHITTTERYLHYAPDAEGAAKLTALWGERDGAPQGAQGSDSPNVIPLRRAA
jgi:integrase